MASKSHHGQWLAGWLAGCDWLAGVVTGWYREYMAGRGPKGAHREAEGGHAEALCTRQHPEGQPLLRALRRQVGLRQGLLFGGKGRRRSIGCMILQSSPTPHCFALATRPPARTPTPTKPAHTAHLVCAD
jgi:hypothetical protein